MKIDCIDESKYITKKYPHFDKKISFYKVKSYVTNPSRIEEHSFFPLIHYTKNLSKYSKNYIDKDSSKDIHQRHIKPKKRDIMYASHIDGYIYKYYGECLNNQYNLYAAAHGIDSCALAYRNNKASECNIQFARDVFEFIHSQEACYIRVSDFEKFFDRLDHTYLSKMVASVLKCNSLPKDWYKVIKSVTRYTYIEKEAIAPFYDKRNERYFSKIKQFRIFRKQHPDVFHLNTNSFGIPQGTAISGILANTYMIDVDQTICELVSHYDGLYRRYSDDTIIIIPKEKITKSEWDDLEYSINEIIKSAKVSEQKEKTHTFIYQNNGLYDINATEKISRILDYLGFTFDGQQVRVRQKGIYKFERKANEALKASIRAQQHKNLSYLPYQSMLLRYCLDKPYKKKNGKYKRQTNFISYIRRVAQDYENSDLSCYPEQQMHHLRKKIKHRYRNANKNILPNPND